MIRNTNDPWALDITQDWEERDEMVGRTFSVEGEQWLLRMARDVRTQLMELPLHGTPEELDTANRSQIYLRGQFDLLLLLVAASKEERIKTTAQQTE